MIINKLYIMGLNKYIKYIKEQILESQWFKQACKDKKVTVKYLSKDFFKTILSGSYFIYKNAKNYFYKLLLIKFDYNDNLEDNQHLKLLNVNVVNETRYQVIEFLTFLQKKFLKTNHFFDMKIIDREEFILNYMKKYKRYLDNSILSKILKHTYFMFNKCMHKLDFLIPKKKFIYSIYIKEVINTNLNIIKNDEQIASLLNDKYNIKLSRRAICDIRNQYLIPTIKNINNSDFFLLVTNFFSDRKILNKKNISLLPNNIQGVYELSTNKVENYPFLTNRVVYIGSSKDIKKRLSTYTIKYAHTEEIKAFLKEGHKIYFRFIKSLEYKEFEKKAINNFIYLYGDLPRLNTQRVL